MTLCDFLLYNVVREVESRGTHFAAEEVEAQRGYVTSQVKSHRL